MKHNKIQKLAIISLICALSFVATYLMIPMPIGNINLGDGFLLAFMWLFGSVPSVFAVSIGVAICDIVSGFAVYAPATFIIKALMAFAAFFLRKLLVHINVADFAARLLSAVVAEIIMISGYFIYEALFLSYGLSATVGLITNTIQAIGGLILGFLLYKALSCIRKNKQTK